MEGEIMAEENKIIVDPFGKTDSHEVRGKQDERHYRWVTPDKASKRQMQAYLPVGKDDPEQAGSHLSAEGHRMLGKKTLMYCPKHIRQTREQKALDLDALRRKKTKEDFHAEGDRSGFETFEVDRVPKRGGGYTEIEKPGASGHKPTFAMGAGISKETGELERPELPSVTHPEPSEAVPGPTRRTMMDELKEQPDKQ
jgi:hypothetical protein